ncbi:hypothetical protein S245_048100, partial [Arachis hypogaea]
LLLVESVNFGEIMVVVVLLKRILKMASSQTPSETPPSQEQASSATPTPDLTTKRVYNNSGKTDPVWVSLAGKGGDVEKCKKVPPVVAHQFGQNIEEFMNKERKTQENYAESYGACDDVEREFDRMEELEARQQQQQHSRTRLPPPAARKGKKTTGIETYFPSSRTPGAQPTIK